MGMIINMTDYADEQFDAQIRQAIEESSFDFIPNWEPVEKRLNKEMLVGKKQQRDNLFVSIWNHFRQYKLQVKQHLKKYY